MLEWHLNNEIEKALFAFDPISNFNETISYAAEYMDKHPYLGKFIQDSLAREKLTQLLTKTLYPKSHEIINNLEVSHSKSIEPEFKDFLTKNLTHIAVLSILDSIENPNNYDIEKLKRYISILFDMSVTNLFQQI